MDKSADKICLGTDLNRSPAKQSKATFLVFDKLPPVTTCLTVTTQR